MIIPNRITRFSSFLTILFTLFISISASADGFIKKEVYSFKDKSGNMVFTDKEPAKKQTYNTQIIEAANSTGNNTVNNTYQNNSATKDFVEKSYPVQQQIVRVVVEQNPSTNKDRYKNKRSLKRCKSYKKKFDYYSDRMNSGYKSTEYKRLESKRKKYRKLLFNHCETKTFSD